MIKNIKKSKIYGGLAALALASGLESQAVLTQFVYDDFSSGVLDASKWNINQSEPLMDQYGVRLGGGLVDGLGGGLVDGLGGGLVDGLGGGYVFHTRQNNIGDRSLILEPIHKFVFGESFSYQFKYNSGNGNNFSQPLINGNYPPTQIEHCSASGGCGAIGYWNGIPDLEAQVGNYRINFEFFVDEVKMTTIRPDNVVVINTFTGNSQPYDLGINIHTGHNGTLDVELDNFVITTEIPEPSSYGIALGLGVLGAGMLKRRMKREEIIK